MRHLDETMPGPALMPEDPVERAKAEQWISVLNCYGYPAMVRNLRAAIRLSRAAPTGSRTARRSKRRCPRSARSSARSIAPSTRATISSATASRLADILLVPMIEYVKAMPEGKELMSAFPDLRRATERLAQRPSYVAAIQPPAL